METSEEFIMDIMFIISIKIVSDLYLLSNKLIIVNQYS